jgi:hypothetical protein
MIRRGLLAGIVAAAVVVVVGGVFLGQQAGTPTASMSDPAGAPTPAPADQGPSTAPPSRSASAGPAEPEPDGAEPQTGEAEPDGADPGETNRSDTVPAPEATPPALVTMPLPDSSTAAGSLVAGFPVDVIPEAPNSVIETSSVATEGSQVQVALSGQTTLPAGEVVDYYRAALTERGLSGAPAPAPEGSTALAFTLGINSVALTVTPIDGGCRYVVFGTFTAES